MYERLKWVNFNNPPYSTSYPNLATILDENPGLPVNNIVSNNIFLDGTWLQYNPERPEYWEKLVVVNQNLVNPEVTPVTKISDLLDQLTSRMHQRKYDFNPINLEKIGIQETY